MTHLTHRRAFLQALVSGAAGLTLTWPTRIRAQGTPPPITATKLTDRIIALRSPLHPGPGARHAGRARQQLRGMLRLRQAELQSAIAADTSRLAQVEARLRIIELEGAMPVDDIQVKRIPAVRVAELTATAARLEPASINPVIQPLYRELGERLGQAGLTPAGPATSYYEDAPDGDGVIVHAALPVNADPGSAHGFEITDLPEITQAATIMHRGPMDNVMATIQILARWIDENGYRSSGHVRELTLECPDDPDKWVTELQEPITPA